MLCKIDLTFTLKGHWCRHLSRMWIGFRTANGSNAHFVVLEQEGCSAWQRAHPQLVSAALVWQGLSGKLFPSLVAPFWPVRKRMVIGFAAMAGSLRLCYMQTLHKSPFERLRQKLFTALSLSWVTVPVCHMCCTDPDSGRFDRLDGSSSSSHLSRWLLLCCDCRWQLLLWLIALQGTQGQTLYAYEQT